MNAEKLNLSVVYSENYRYVYTFVKSTLKTSEVAEEVTNDVFIKFNNHLDDFTTEKSKLQTYLLVIAKSCIIDYFRREDRHSNTIGVDTFINDSGDSFIQIKSQSTDAINQISYKETTAKVQKIISTIKNEDHKKVTELFFFDDLSYQSIADICQVSLANVKVILNRSRQLLQSELKAVR